MKDFKKQVVNYFNESMAGKRSNFATILLEDEKPAEKPAEGEPKPIVEGEKPIVEAKVDLPPADDKNQKEGKMDISVPPEPEKPEDAEKDSQDKADEILEKIDLKSMDNKAKIELITSIIDVLQDSCDTDEEFSDYMNKLTDTIDSYKFEKNPDKEEVKEGEPGEGEEGEPKEGEEPKGIKIKAGKNKTKEPPAEVNAEAPVISGVEK